MMPSTSQEEIPPPPPPPPSSQTPTQQTPHTVSTIKLPILKKGEYDIWAMKMEHYLAHIDYPIWEVIQNGNGPVSITTDTSGQIKVLPPRTVKEIVARERERKARTTLLMALPEDNLAKFHKMTDAKEMWDAIKSRFGGNDESQEDAKVYLTQQFEGFSVTNHRKMLHKVMTVASGHDLNENKKFYKKTGRKLQFDAKENSGNKDGNRTGQKEDSKALVTVDGEVKGGICVVLQRSYVNLKKLFDAQREQLSDASIEIKAYSQGLKKVEAQLVAHQQGQLCTEPSELVSEPVVIESNVESQPKVWSDAPIIKEYESDSEDECVSIPTKQQETPSFANQQVKTPRENVKSQNTHSQKPKVDKKDLGHGCAVRACFVCGSLNHLIRDCDFHEKRMARKANLNNSWNNVKRMNKQNQFVPSPVLTRTGIIPVSTARASSTKKFSIARQNFNRQTVLTNAVRKVNNVKPIVNRVRPANVFHNTHSPTKPFKKTTVLRPIFPNKKFNTTKDYPHRALKNKGIVDSGCSRHMTGNKAYLDEFQDFNGGHVAFGGSRGYITGTGKIKTGKLDFEDVCFVKELQHFNLFSVSQICDKKNKVLFTDSECLVLSPEFKLPDENQVLLKIPRQNNMYNFNLENIVPTGGLACLIAKATTNESNKWHMRLGHVNFKNLNKLVKGNLVRGLPSKIFQNDHTCVACQKGKQHKASCKAKAVSSISQTLQLLHMDLFGPTSVRSLNHKTYYLVITDDFKQGSRGNIVMPELHNKMELLRERTGPLLRLQGPCLQIHFYLTLFGLKQLVLLVIYDKTFGCHYHLLIPLTTLASLLGKSDEGFLVGYSLQSKAFRVYNLETKRVEENLHITFLENKPNVAGKGPTWLFDLDYLTDSMEISSSLTTDDKREGPREEEQVFMDDLERLKRQEEGSSREAEALRKKFETLVIKEGAAKPSSTNIFSTVSTPVKASSTNPLNTASIPVSTHRPIRLMTIIADLKQHNKKMTQKYLHLRISIKIPLMKISEALEDESWVDAMQEELLQFEIQKVWVLVDLPYGKKAIGTKWVYRNKKDERGVVVRNKARLVAQGHRQEEGIDYDEVFAHVARLEAIRIFLAFASYMGFVVYQIDVKSASFIQNQMLDYGFNFMNTKIYIDNESTICIVKNPVYHSKTKHIAIRHHFIRDAYEKKLIQVLKIHTNDNVADLLTKAFDVSRFQFLVVSIGMLYLNLNSESWLDGSDGRIHLYLEDMFVKGLRRSGESLRRVSDGAKAFLIFTLFILCLDKVSTDHVKLVPLGKVCTAKETLETKYRQGYKV
ncbi:putative ribonuclease H-like domain-containing protein [Tanacetum coccineum]